MLDTVAVKKVEDKNKQSMIEKIIYGVEFESLYESNSEKKPEIMNTIEANYRIARRVYQQLHLDISELFMDFIRSMSIYELQDMDEDIKVNGWGVKSTHTHSLININSCVIFKKIHNILTETD